MTVETQNRCQSVCLVETHLSICHMTYLGQIDLDLDLDQGSNFEIDKIYIFRIALTRETRWCQNYRPIFIR